jgi:hypothetical protein
MLAGNGEYTGYVRRRVPRYFYIEVLHEIACVADTVIFFANNLFKQPVLKNGCLKNV